MRLEILVIAALAALASAAPQWPYRDAVAPYYYGYPGKTPYMYRAGEEDDEIEDMARQDLKVASSDGSGSTVTVVEDDESEKADGVRVVETGSAKPLKPVVQSANNNQQQQEQQQPAAASQAQQPLNTNNANNAQQQTSGQPLTVQQPGQQPPAFPPARPAPRPRPPTTEQEDDDEEDDESEEDDEEAEDEEEEGDSGDEEDEEEDEEERRRDNIAIKEGSTEDSAQVPAVQQEEPQSSAVNGEGSDEVVPEVQPVVIPEPQQPVSQTAVVSNKVNKNKQASAAVAAKPVASSGHSKKKPVSSKGKPSGGAIEALVPGYVTDQGEVLVPVDTVTGSQPITIVPDPFSPPSRIVSGPRPIPQSAVPHTARRQVPYWYRSSHVINPLTQESGHSPMSGQTLYSAVPPPGSIFTFDDDDDDEDDAEDSPSIIPGNRLRQDDDNDDEDEDEDEDDRKKKAPPPPQKVPLASVPAVGNSGEDDEAEALAFINSGKPLSNRRPANAPVGNSAPSGGNSGPASGNKRPGAGGNRKPAGQAGSNESESEEENESEEDEEDEEEDEEDEARSVVAHPAQIAAAPRGRMYVDEEYVSFPPSRSPTVFAVVQGKFPGGPGGIPQRRQPQIISSQNPGNPHQRYVVRVTPANRPRPQASPVYYRPMESRHPPNRRVVPIASFDVSVEDTRPSPSIAVDSDEDSESVVAGGPTPVTSYPFVYKVQGSVQGVRIPSRRPGSSQSLAALLGGPGGQQSLAALLGGPGGHQSLAGILGGRPPRPSVAYYGSSEQSFSAIRPARPGRPRPPYSFAAAVYGSSPYGGPPGGAFSLGSSGESFSYGPPPGESFGYGPPPSEAFGYGPPPSGSYGYGPPPRPSGSSHGFRPPRPSGSSHGYGPPRPSGSSHGYGPPRPSGSSHGYGPPRPSISSHGRPSGPPVIVRRKQPGGRPQRPPKPHLIAVYNPNGPSSSGPGPREPVEEEYYTFEVPETNNKIVSGGPSKNKRPTVHRKPTPVVHQKQVMEDEEELDSDESPPGSAPPPHQIKIIPQGTVRRRIRGGKQLKPKKNSKKTTSSSSKKQQQDQQDPLGLLSKINKSKSKMH